MATKKPSKKGDEPVRAGVGRAQTIKGFVRDPYGYTSGKNMNKGVAQAASAAVTAAKKKYGTKFVVDVSMDGVVRTKPTPGRAGSGTKKR